MMLVAVEQGGLNKCKRELKGPPAGLNMERDLIREVGERDTPRKTDILILVNQQNDGAVRDVRRSQFGSEFYPLPSVEKSLVLLGSHFFFTCKCNKKSKILLRSEAEYILKGNNKIHVFSDYMKFYIRVNISYISELYRFKSSYCQLPTQHIKICSFNTQL